MGSKEDEQISRGSCRSKALEERSKLTKKFRLMKLEIESGALLSLYWEKLVHSFSPLPFSKGGQRKD